MKTFLKTFAAKAATASFIVGDTMCQLSIDAHAKLTDQDREASERELRIKSLLIQVNYMGMHKDLSVQPTGVTS